MVIIIDNREKENSHIKAYFDAKKITYMQRTLSTGDYSAFIPKNEELGIMRDIQLNACVERKASIDEITGNLGKLKRSAFINELIRASQNPFTLVVEDADGYGKILRGDYRSAYDPKALLGSLKSFEVKYNFSIVFLDKAYIGNYIYYHFYYRVNEYLKSGVI
jgi:ERCC4-type nuclease